MANAYLSEIARQYVIAKGVAPAAVAAVGWRRGDHFDLAEGAAFRGGSEAADEHAFFDLASITKSFTACTVARLVQRGRFDFDTALRDLLPEARGARTGRDSVIALLSHRAGLQAHRR